MYRELYNKAYQKFTPDFLEDREKLERYFETNSLSLRRYLVQYKQQFEIYTQDKNCLELGSGLGCLSQFLGESFKEVLGIDISNLAVGLATQVNNKPHVNFKTFDILSGETLPSKYDFILDSHLFHCLTSDSQRNEYYSFVKKHLSPQGVLLVESMVLQPNIRIPVEYNMDENFTLHQGDIPIRSILPSKELEESIKNSGLNLHTFFYHSELSFEVFDLYPDYPAQFLPKTVRLSANLP